MSRWRYLWIAAVPLAALGAVATWKLVARSDVEQPAPVGSLEDEGASSSVPSAIATEVASDSAPAAGAAPQARAELPVVRWPDMPSSTGPSWVHEGASPPDPTLRPEVGGTRPHPERAPRP